MNSLADTPFDLLESLLAAILLRRRSAHLPQFTQCRYLLRFFALAVVAAPALTGLLHAAILTQSRPAAFLPQWLHWFVTGSLGVSVTTPACVAILRTRILRLRAPAKAWASLLAVLPVSFAVFGQSRAPLPFVLYPLLVLVLIRLGLGWAAAATLFMAAVGGGFTLHGRGPFAASHVLSRMEPAVVLQLFVASAMMLLYGVSLVLEDLDKTYSQLQETLSLHKLVTENSRDVIIIADFEGRRRFVSDAGSYWGGWSRQELLSHKSLELVHPDDRRSIAEIVRALRSGKEDALAECRVQAKDGSYIWVEASLRTIRDPISGIPTGIMNSVRDITTRKLAEQQLAEAYRSVEALAITDALTGLANRRHFDQSLTTEWRRAMRERRPLSLVLIDADLFKGYNDTFGHLRGDNCLKQIAEAILDVVSRPGDLVARFGGEEFAVILPNTPAHGALQVAQDICAVMRDRQLPYPASAAGFVTVSTGCATLVPQFGQHAVAFVDRADHALYEAKHKGRNRACAYDAEAAAAISGNLIAMRSA